MNQKNLPANANHYITNNNKISNNEQVIRNKQQLIYRFASEDLTSPNDKRSTDKPQAGPGSTSSNRSAQKDYSFITEKYEQAAQILPREEIFSVSFSLLGRKDTSETLNEHRHHIQAWR